MAACFAFVHPVSFSRRVGSPPPIQPRTLCPFVCRSQIDHVARSIDRSSRCGDCDHSAAETSAVRSRHSSSICHRFSLAYFYENRESTICLQNTVEGIIENCLSFVRILRRRVYQIFCLFSLSLLTPPFKIARKLVVSCIRRCFQ